MTRRTWLFCLFAATIGCAAVVPPTAVPTTVSGTITKDAVWSGTVIVEKDVLIPKGRTVTVAPGTTVFVQKADISRTEPVFLQPETEILVQGKITIAGTAQAPVTFRSNEEKGDVRDWAGVIVHGGALAGRHLVVRNAYAALTVMTGTVDMADMRLSGNYTGIVLMPEAAGSVCCGVVTDNRTGVVTASPKTILSKLTIRGNGEGLVADDISPESSMLEITDNIHGAVLPAEAIPVLMRGNRIYANGHNLYIARRAVPR